jgi:hypothetical protein
MANSISVQTSMTSTVDGFTLSKASSLSANTTSSNAIGQTLSVTSSVWTQLSLGILTDVTNIYVWNDNTVNTASVVSVATGSTGGNVIAVLQPGAAASIPWSGSFNGLYAKVVTAAPAINGTVQYIAQQS